MSSLPQLADVSKYRWWYLVDVVAHPTEANSSERRAYLFDHKRSAFKRLVSLCEGSRLVLSADPKGQATYVQTRENPEYLEYVLAAAEVLLLMFAHGKQDQPIAFAALSVHRQPPAATETAFKKECDSLYIEEICASSHPVFVQAPTFAKEDEQKRPPSRTARHDPYRRPDYVAATTRSRHPPGTVRLTHLGARMLAEIEELAIDRRLPYVTLESTPGAESFYLKHGYSYRWRSRNADPQGDRGRTRATVYEHYTPRTLPGDEKRQGSTRATVPQELVRYFMVKRVAPDEPLPEEQCPTYDGPRSSPSAFLDTRFFG